MGRARGLPPTYVTWLALLDAANDGDVERGRAVLAGLEAEHPGWRDLARTLAKHPEGPPLADILGE